MKQQSVIGIYSTMTKAEAAVRQLSRGQFPMTHISILTMNLNQEKGIVGFVTPDDTLDGNRGNAWIGGMFGFLYGSALLWIPNMGPLYIAGSLAGELSSNIAGTAEAEIPIQLLSSLTGWSVGKNYISKYADALKTGKFLVIAHGIQTETAKAFKILKNTKQDKLDYHRKKN